MGKLGISFGAFADQIIKQLTAQGYEAPASRISHWQQDADAICRLRIRGVLADAEASKANKRLFKTICKEAKPTTPVHGPLGTMGEGGGACKQYWKTKEAK